MTEEQRIQLNKVNAEIKRAYALSRRKKWEKLSGNLDPKTPDSRLWRIAKGLNREDIMSERTNTILDPAGYMTHNDKDAANALATHYQKIGSLDFSETDRHTQRKARAVSTVAVPLTLKRSFLPRNFHCRKLEQALPQMDWTKSPGPDGLHGRMIEHLGPVERQSLLDIFNLSWRNGRLPRDWKRAIIIPIKKQESRLAHQKAIYL
ncbi:hypothetical protein AVEN_143931-1 [Araneus ventricosus]|uniref:RNA-directed DNA polymerase from mobile element jockey n=1 Tax=Araneus ventricosus TaxID=182803 RepID=A0A4Y2L005_ARAVE|nr:hypothetical protein AVEN_143931-1 [Araneus ventricosus]